MRRLLVTGKGGPVNEARERDRESASGDSRFQSPRTPRKNTGTWNRTSRMMKLCVGTWLARDLACTARDWDEPGTRQTWQRLHSAAADHRALRRGLRDADRYDRVLAILCSPKKVRIKTNKLCEAMRERDARRRKAPVRLRASSSFVRRRSLPCL